MRDGDDAEAPLVGRYCGTRSPPTIVSRGAALHVAIVSRYYTGVGFHARYAVFSAGLSRFSYRLRFFCQDSLSAFFSFLGV